MLRKIIWDIYAWSYDSGVKSLDIYSQLLDAVIDRLDLQKEDVILDIGCGTGNLEERIEERDLRYKKIEGIDISDSMIQRANRKVKSNSVIFSKVDANQKLPYKSNSIDKVVMIHSLYAMEQPEDVLEEINRVLIPGGRLVVANPFDKGGMKNIRSYAFKGLGPISKILLFVKKLPILMINMFIAGLAKKGSYHFMDQDEIREILSKTGFSDVKKFEKVYADTDILFVSSAE